MHDLRITCAGSQKAKSGKQIEIGASTQSSSPTMGMTPVDFRTGKAYARKSGSNVQLSRSPNAKRHVAWKAIC